MDEVSSYVRLVPAVRLTARPPKRLFRLVFESHDGRALGADSEEKHEPVSDIDTAVADSLKVLDLKRPIREADSICSTRVLPGVTRTGFRMVPKHHFGKTALAPYAAYPRSVISHVQRVGAGMNIEGRFHGCQGIS